MSKKNIVILASLIALIVICIGGFFLLKGNNKAPNTVLNMQNEKDMTAFINEVYNGLDIYRTENILVDLNDKEAVKSYIGFDDTEKIDNVVVSEPMMSSQAYSLILVKVKEEKDADEIAKKMFSSVNPRKWICVTAENVFATSSGNIAMLVMSDEETTNSVYKNFKNLAGKIGPEYTKIVEE